MSTTATSLDIKEHLVGFLRHSGDLYCKDLAATPEDKLTQSPMGCARSPRDFTAECVGYNRFAAATLRGEKRERPSDEERNAFVQSLDTGEKLRTALADSVEDLAQAVSASSADDLSREVVAPWGARMSAFSLAHIAGTHMQYHDGQLNYFQCLHGDDAMHWF